VLIFCTLRLTPPSITEKSGLKSNIKPPPPPATLVLDATTFDDVVLNPEHDTIVAFTAPWCGHCKRLKPIFEEVAQDFVREPKCIVANVDADAAQNKDLAARYGVGSYPTIKFFPKGGEPVAYEGGRSEEDFVSYLNEHCGTNRALGGALNDVAGRLPAFDEIASKFFVAEAASRDAIFQEANVLAAEVGTAAKHYLRAMEKVLNGTEDYFVKESKRCVCLYHILIWRGL
jgi:protein disulfide-isomerase A6